MSVPVILTICGVVYGLLSFVCGYFFGGLVEKVKSMEKECQET